MKRMHANKLAIARASVMLLGVLTGSAQPDEDGVVVRLDEHTRAANVSVRYFLTGGFGGVSSFEVDRSGSKLILPTSYEGKPAQKLKAVLYAPGCEMRLIETDLPARQREDTFDCRKTRDVLLDGMVRLPRRDTFKDLDVEIKYFAVWVNRFFGIMDGAVWSVPVARVPLDENGRFRARLPDFSADPLSATVAKDAAFWILLRERRSGNLAGSLSPPEAWCEWTNLRISPSYPSGLEFTLEQPSR